MTVSAEDRLLLLDIARTRDARQRRFTKGAQMDIYGLEYPRHLHKPHGAYLHVDTPEQADAALADGWSIEVPPDPVAETPAPEPEPSAADYAAAKKRGR